MNYIYLLILWMAGAVCSYAQSNIKGFEYWFNHDLANKTIANVAPTQQLRVNQIIPTAGLANGINVFNFRSVDEEGKYSPVMSRFFYKMSAPENNPTPEIVAYEYWVDNNYSDAVLVNTPVQQKANANELISMSTLGDGIHVFNIRFKDNEGVWSSTTSEFFYKMADQPAGNNLINQYRYWVDDDFANAVNVALQAPGKQFVLIDDPDLAPISRGEHAVSFQFQDSHGRWSSVATNTVNKTALRISVTQEGTVLTANVTGAEYQWLDCNNNHAAIDGETNRSFTATQNGSYGVEVTQYSSADTSACYAVTTVDVVENTFTNEIIVYPNPTNGMVRVDLGKVVMEFTVRINDVTGKLISISTYKNRQTLELNLNGKPGIYLMTINSGNKCATINLIKN